MFVLKRKEELPGRVNMVSNGIIIGKFPLRQFLDLFEPEALSKGVKFTNRVPVVTAYPECFTSQAGAESEIQVEMIDKSNIDIDECQQ
jgi:hypothetical protein